LHHRALACEILVAHSDVRPTNSVKHRDVARRSAGESFRECNGIGSVPAICGGAEVESFRQFNAPERGGKDHSNPGTIHVVEVDARVLKSKRRSHQGPYREAIKTPCL